MTVAPGSTDVPAAGLLKNTWPLREPPPLTGVNPRAWRAAMASDTVIPYRFEGIVTGCGPSEMTMLIVLPSSAEPVGAQVMTSVFGTDELYCWVQLASRPTATSVVVAPAQVWPVSDGMVSLGGPAETRTLIVDP